jgi:hypothetical protein
MRKSLLIPALLVLAGCGGSERGTTSPSLLKSVGNVVTGNSHSCPEPVPSGSAEQVACHEAAKAACAVGTAPKQVDFTQAKTGRYAGQFVVRGYSCV